MFEIIWTWVLAHVPDAFKLISGTKLIADTIDSVKKLAPEHLEMKGKTFTYAEETLQLATDTAKGLEERQIELDARTKLTESMVKLTAIEASYNIARYAIFTACAVYTYRAFVRFVGWRRNQKSGS